MGAVETTSGPIQGHAVTGGPGRRRIWHFGGVPYGDATRFGLPRAPERWTDPLDVTTPGAAPPQRQDGPELVPGMVPAETSEACLTAEIWTPSRRGSRPVLVWIPGGSFRIGGAGLPTYDGRHVAAEGELVVVGLNYRLGALGFLAAEGVPSNLGLRDLLLALDWVRANAAGFGGDPDRIILMGESAGAGAITHLLTRPDLPCAGAIVLSGSATMTLDHETAQQVARRTFELAGASDLDEFRALELDQLLDAQTKAVTDLAGSVGMMPFHPWVDGDVVPISPLDAAATDRLAPIPLVLGTTAHEMELYRDIIPELPTDVAVRYLHGLAKPLHLDAATVERGLAACGGDLVTAIADLTLQLPPLLIAESHVRRGVPVWRASFTWESPAHRACHALDLPFHFGTLDVAGWREFAGAVEAAAEADELSERVREAWASFATSGRPACSPIGEWPPFGGDQPHHHHGQVIELGYDVVALPDPAADRLASWR